MTTRRPSPQLYFALCCTAALAVSACSSSDRGTGGVKPGRFPDATVTTNPDATVNDTPDSGQNNNTCGANPNNCAPNELVGAPPSCTCLNVCATGFLWNANTRTCDAVGNPDGGVPNDGGNMGNPDSGVPPGMTCVTDTDCTMNTMPICLDVGANITRCAGQQTCQCFSQCDPFVTAATSGCMAGQGCFWLGSMGVVPGVCGADQGGGTQAQPCNAMYDPAGNFQGDSCNSAQNYFCLGTSPQNPTGICGRLCRPTNDQVCASLGNYTCDNLGDPTLGYGLCLGPEPAFTDLGNSCTAAGQCQGGVCSQVLNGSCTSSCGGLSQCPANGVCVNAGPDGLICALECTPGNDATCSQRNAQTVCENIAGPGEPPLGICIPRCTQDAECGAGGICNTATGHCQ